MVHIADDGILFAHDPTRGRNLSLQRINLVFNYAGVISNNSWLKTSRHGSTSGETGYPMARNAVVTNIAAMGRQVNTGDIELKITKNDDDAGTDLIRLQFPQTGADESPIVISGSLNIDLDQADFLQVIVKDNGSGGGIRQPLLVAEIAWRDA